MKRGAILLSLALCGLLAAGRPARCEIGTIDDVPAATLLLPYFEVDLDHPDGVTTLFSINNAAPGGVLARVTLWTDEAIPTLGFDLYLTGYDVQTLNLRNVFDGILPVTASAGQDPKDTISPRGPVSRDIDFASCAAVLPLTPPLAATIVGHLRAAHTGRPSAAFGGKCSGFDFGDNIARGYVTVDVVRQCSPLFPSSPGYFATVAGFLNVLWGDYFYVDVSQSYAQGETLVGSEACAPGGLYRGRVGNGAGRCPFAAGDYTFYGRYVAGNGSDQREPLPTTFATRYVEGGAFTSGTQLLVWRDTRVPPTGADGPFTCDQKGPSWFPIDERSIVSFDEMERFYESCFPSDNTLPVSGPRTCFPLGAQRISLSGGNNPTGAPGPPFAFGWLLLDLNDYFPPPGRLFSPAIQSWVTTVISAQGRFSVGFDAIQLDTPEP